MSYIGKEPQTGAYSMLDALTASATASYSLTLDSVAFVPESANHLLVSLNGSIQKAGSSFTVSGSTLTFSSTLASSDSIDFVLALGNVLDIGTPSDATVTNAKTNFVSTSSAAGLQIKGDGTTDGTLQLNCSQNSHGIKLKSPAHSASQSYTLTFPATAPVANKALITDGSGNLSFGDAAGGKIGQVVNANKTDTFSSTSGSYVDVTGVSASITPSATTSKIFVIITLYVSSDTQTSNTFARIVRDSTSLQESINRVPQENQGVYRTYNLSMTHLDSPSSTSALTYKLQMLTNGGTFYVNRAANQGGFSGTHTVTLTLMEVLA